MARKMKRKWMQDLRIKKGAFGRATASKIAAGKRKGGKAKKRAVLAETFKRVAQRRKRKRTATRR